MPAGVGEENGSPNWIWKRWWSRRWVGRENQGRTRRLSEIEVLQQVAELRESLADIRARVWAAIGPGVKALATEEIVFDELDVGIKAQYLVINVSLLGIGADHETGYPQAVAIFVDTWRRDVIIEAAPVVPGKKDGRAAPVGALHDGVDKPGDVGLTFADQGRGMLAGAAIRHDPGNGRERTGPGILVKVVEGLDIVELLVLANR